MMHINPLQIASNLTKPRQNPNGSGKLVFRAWQFYISPSRRISKSFQHINSLLHRKSCKAITSAWSAPTQAYFAFAGLVNVRKMISSGFNRNFLPQFVIILWKFPLPLSSKTLIASPKTPRLRLFSQSTCVTHSCRSISQPLTQLSDWHFISISIHSIFIALNGSFCIVYF